MTHGSSGSGRRKLGQQVLTAEDLALWQRLSQSLVPLHRSKPRVPGASPASPEGSPLEPRRPAPPSPPAGRGAPSLPATAERSRTPAHLAPAEPGRFDRQRMRKITAGRIAIEARLDLHGARQGEAHRRFRAFLHACAAKGYSTVLVVTGKGGRRDAADRQDPGYAPVEQGILRRSVPLWLEEPDLRALVVGYATAGLRHGGEGALYIQLRRRLLPRP